LRIHSLSLKPGAMNFVISRKPEGAYQYYLKDAQGKQILWSPRFATKAQCKKGIEHLRKQVEDKVEVDRWQTDSGRYLFHLRSRDGHLLAMSAPFSSKHECVQHINAVREHVYKAEEEDVSIYL